MSTNGNRPFGASAAIVAAVTLLAAGCGGSSVSTANPDKLAAQINAAWCQDSGFYLTNRLDRSKAEVYDCNLRNGSYECVSEEGGIPQNVTSEFRAVIATAIVKDQEKPSCVTVNP